MPLYDFVNENTGETFQKFLSMKERDEYLTENPHIKQKLSAPSFGDSVRLGFRKIDDGFNDVLLKAKNAHRGSTINTK